MEIIPDTTTMNREKIQESGYLYIFKHGRMSHTLLAHALYSQLENVSEM